jgi:aminomethyltransferase
MGPFAGWDMPLHYGGVREEHRAVRERCGVFDVSHMGQIAVTGPGAQAYLRGILTNDIGVLAPGQGQYTLVCRDDGGVIDDLIVYRLADEEYLIVCNAANIDPVTTWVAGRAIPGTDILNRSDEYAMLAVQGRDWEAALAPVAADPAALDGLAYFELVATTIADHPALVARTGYTGEPGIEIICPSQSARAIWDGLMAGPDAPTPAGLVARDTLRMEMGYPLYGQELSLERTPIEAGLKWACNLDGDAPGVEVMRRQVADGTDERLCIFTLTEPGIPRTGCPVLHDGRPAGVVTSGTLSPTLDVGIGMAYVRADLAPAGNALQIDIRGKLKNAETRKRPLVDTTPKAE